ncbi:MAG: tol-pal system-associated acyl-CoA thioesterase [Caulobacter sp.]|nr:tol-pal system-associated acyl-CoA thioesterase [Vitreoscilla sp.]
MNPAVSPVPAAHFHHPVRVYWEDTDAGGIVFYANYLKFFERARTEWLRALGHGQQEMVDSTGCMFVVQETSVRYRSPARLDDLLTITVDVRERGRASLRIAQQAWCGDRLLAEGEIRIGCVERATMKPHRIPGPIFEAIE